MHRVAGDDMAGQVEFLQQLLHGGDFVGLFVDLDMRQHQRRVDGERAEHLFCLDVVEVIETALERLAIERNDARVGARVARFRLAACSRKAFSTSAALSPCKYIGWPYARAAFSI